jgi:hypothetical protein
VRGVGRAALVAAGAVVLSACTGVPTSGPIQQGPVVAVAGGDQIIRVIAREPSADMSPEEIVRGFQEATASADAEHQIAKKYLTDAAAAAWKPDSGVQVYDDTGLATSTKGDVVTQEGVLSATIAADSQYAVVAPTRRTIWEYRLARVDGEWRIASLPQGLVLGSGDIQRSYRTYDLYYFTRDFVGLVPAPVTMPVSPSGQATLLVTNLLAGPTSWIAPAVRSAFPEGTKLALGTVPVTDGVADVALSAEVLDADDEQRQKLSAQLVWTLRQVPSVTGVRITVNGQPLQVPGVALTQPVDSWSILAPSAFPEAARAYAVGSKGLVALATDGRAGQPLALRPSITSPAVSLDSTLVAGITENRRELVVGELAPGATAVRRWSGSDLSRPTWDRTGAVWVVDRGTGLVVVRGAKADPVAVGLAPKGFRDADILAVSMARDGTRLAMLVRRGTLVEPWLARVERNGAGIAVSAPMRVDTQLTEALDLAWSDADTLVVLGTSGATSLEVVDIGVGSSRVRHQAVPDATVTSVTAAPSRSYLLGDRGFLWRGAGASWVRVDDLTDPVYPG